MNAFKSMWLDAQLQKFDEYDSEVSDATLAKLSNFRDEIMSIKISTARAEVDAGLTNKERAIKAAYEAVKLKISKIEDHHFQYNVRSLLEDAKAEADRRCSRTTTSELPLLPARKAAPFQRGSLSRQALLESRLWSRL